MQELSETIQYININTQLFEFPAELLQDPPKFEDVNTNLEQTTLQFLEHLPETPTSEIATKIQQPTTHHREPLQNPPKTSVKNSIKNFGKEVYSSAREGFKSMKEYLKR